MKWDLALDILLWTQPVRSSVNSKPSLCWEVYCGNYIALTLTFPLPLDVTTFSIHWVLGLRDHEGESFSTARLALAVVHGCQGPAMRKSHT